MTELPMHFMEVLMFEERYKRKILAELRGGSSVSKNIISGRRECVPLDVEGFPECIAGVQKGGKHVFPRWSLIKGCSSIHEPKEC